MKAAEIRRLAKDYDSASLQMARQALMEGEGLPFDVEGTDDGERLTHINLALRIAKRVEAGEDPKAVFRDVMAGVRDILS